MNIPHHDLVVPLDDAWWKKAGMESFIRKLSAYTLSSSNLRADVKVCLIAIDDVEPLRREPMFRDNPEDGTAEERVIRILKGFVNGDAIPPIELLRTIVGQPQPYTLKDGAHRFYCSIAAGFSHVPAIKGFDMRPAEMRNDEDLC